MGLTGYYRRFIRGFSKVAYPITSLQKKGTTFKWSQGCQESFEKLKHLLTTALVLKIANPEEELIVCIDACKEGVDGILMHNDKVISYQCCKIT